MNDLIKGFTTMRSSALYLLAILFACTSSNAVAQWNQFQGNAQHTGYAPSLIHAPALTPAWSVAAPAFFGSPGDRSVAIVDGSVYATMRVGQSSPGLYHVSRFDGASGASMWTAAIQSSSLDGVSAPSVSGDRVYVHHFGHSDSTGSTFPYDYPALVGLNRNTGAQESWRTHPGQGNSGSRPTVEGDSVFAAGGYFGGLDGYTLNGAHRWFHALNMQYGWIPAADSDNVYVYMGAASASPGPSVGTLFVVDRITGQRWATILHPRSEGTLFGDRQSVALGGRDDAFAMTFNYTAAATTLVRFDLLTETISWEHDSQFSGNPAIAGGKIVIPDNNVLRVLDQETGETDWFWSAGGPVNGNVVLTDRYAFVNAAGSVQAIDLTTRTSVWSSGGIWGTIALEDGLLVISNPNGIYAFTAPVPEPSALLLALTGGGGFVCIARRFRR